MIAIADWTLSHRLGQLCNTNPDLARWIHTIIEHHAGRGGEAIVVSPRHPVTGHAWETIYELPTPLAQQLGEHMPNNWGRITLSTLDKFEMKYIDWTEA